MSGGRRGGEASVPGADRLAGAEREARLARFLKRCGPAVERSLSVPSDLRPVLTTADVLQEACVDAFLAIDRMPADEDGFRRWLTAIARNDLRDAIRLHRSEKRRRGPELPDGRPSRIGHGSTPSRPVRRAERAAVLHRAADALPEPYRTAALSMLADEPVAVLARRLGKTTGATYMVMTRARKLLARALRDDVGSGVTSWAVGGERS